MSTRNSVVVAGSSPSTRPTCSSSSSNTAVLRGTGDGGADTAEYELPVALQVPQPPLEGGDGDEVLGGARVPERLRGEARQVCRGEVGKLDGTRQGQGGAHLAPGHPRPRVAAPRGGETQVPRAMVVMLVDEGEHRRALPRPQSGDDRPQGGVEVPATLALHVADDTEGELAAEPPVGDDDEALVGERRRQQALPLFPQSLESEADVLGALAGCL